MANTSILEAFKRMWQHVVECMEPKNKLIELDANSEDAALLLEDKMSYIIENPGERLDLVWPLYGGTLGVFNCHIRIVRPGDEDAHFGAHDVIVNFKVKQMVDGEITSGRELKFYVPDSSWATGLVEQNGSEHSIILPFLNEYEADEEGENANELLDLRSKLKSVDISVKSGNSIYITPMTDVFAPSALLTEDIIDNFLAPATE